jgi:tetratricopeptide (TPR) repeat protein
LHRAIELRPDSAQGYLILGNILARFSEPADARKAYEKALALDPRLGMAHANLAILLAFGREFSAAADHFSRAIDLAGDPADRARYYYLRGRIYRQQDSPLEAAKDFEQAIKLRPNYEEAYLELGMTRADLGNDAGALPAFEKAVSLAPEDAGARYQLGTAYLRAGQPQAAAEHLRAAARMQPDDRDTLYALVRALRASGRTEEAEPLMQRLAEEAQRQALHEPDILKAGELNNAGIALEKQGNYTAALEKYRAALQISPQEISFRKNLALALCRLERWREAVAELEKVLQAAPGDPDATKALYIALDKTDGRSK